MQGIGAATASAMLAVVHSSLPFMSDEAAAAVLPASPKYTLPEWRQIAEALRAKATALSSQSGGHQPNVDPIRLLVLCAACLHARQMVM